MTAFFTLWPRYFSAISFNSPNIMPDISSGQKFFVSFFQLTWIDGFPAPFQSTTSKDQCLMSSWTVLSLKSRPINRFTSKTEFFGFFETWYLASSPNNRWSPENATCEGVVFSPWKYRMNYCVHCDVQLTRGDRVSSMNGPFSAYFLANLQSELFNKTSSLAL